MKTAVILLIGLGSLPFLRAQSAAFRHWVLAMSMLAAGAAPLLSSYIPGWQISLPVVARFNHLPDTPAAPPIARASVPVTSSPTAVAGATFSDSPRRIAEVGWVAGTTMIAAFLLMGLLRLWWIRRSSIRLESSRWTQIAADVSRQVGLSQKIQLLQSSRPSLLITWGIRYPKIVLPQGAANWTDDRIRIVLCHELAHIRRGDWLTQLGGEVLKAIYWFNPLTWLATRRLRAESEQACDDEVLLQGIEPESYADELVALARELRRPRSSWLPAPAMARQSSLERRVRGMLNKAVNRSSLTRSNKVAIAGILLLLTLPIAAAQNPFATLSGRLVDGTGGSIVGGKVSLLNTERRSRYEVTAGQGGVFEFVGLPSGIYDLEAAQLGFATYKATVLIAPGEAVTREVVLQIGSLQETITVSDVPVVRTPALKTAAAKPPLGACVATSEGGKIRAPRKVHDVAPQYPVSLIGSGTEGIVVLDGTYTAGGTWRDVQPREGANQLLADAAIAAVQQWQYTQTLLNCVPQDVRFMVTVNFVHR